MFGFGGKRVLGLVVGGQPLAIRGFFPSSLNFTFFFCSSDLIMVWGRVWVSARNVMVSRVVYLFSCRQYLLGSHSTLFVQTGDAYPDEQRSF